MSPVRPVRTGEQVVAPEPLIRIKSAAKVYGKNRGLSPLNLAVNSGERVALVGPSGSGKTTLLRLLAGSLVSDAGAEAVQIDDRPPASLKPGRELAGLVGIVSQRFDLVPHLPALHNVLAGRLGYWSLARAVTSLVWPLERRAAQDALAQVGLADKINERPAHLSGGEQQRVAIARMMMQSPLVVLADEPVASLDPARAEEVMELLVGLTAMQNRTLIASLHTAPLIRRHFTRVIGLRESRLQFDLPADQLTDGILDELYDLSSGGEMEPLAGLAARDG